MKFLVVVFAFCIAAALSHHLTEEQEAKLKEYKEACMLETGVDATVLKNAEEGNVDRNDEKLACTAACMLKKLGMMTDKGEIDEDVIRSKTPSTMTKEQVEEIITKCKDMKGANDCDTARKTVHCYMTENSWNIIHA